MMVTGKRMREWQSWSLNYGKPRRPFRPSEPT
ncbi:hypothetical protein E2I00_006356 [Balaenoptera physalus]|uniref:Uncharacterized protein n=1 Tax=Balaenoptera physalus TaxID=9770 RepID=A0A6A1Q0Q1_BALPH|nr:hypothetical protein E2I00_006356 [Balaenoptera physalus]